MAVNFDLRIKLFNEQARGLSSDQFWEPSKHHLMAYFSSYC